MFHLCRSGIFLVLFLYCDAERQSVRSLLKYFASRRSEMPTPDAYIVQFCALFPPFSPIFGPLFPGEITLFTPKWCRGRGGRGGWGGGILAPPCTRSCEGLGPKAPKNTLFRRLSSPPGPPSRGGLPGDPGPPDPLCQGRDPPRHREEWGWGGCGVCRSVKHDV